MRVQVNPTLMLIGGNPGARAPRPPERRTMAKYLRLAHGTQWQRQALARVRAVQGPRAPARVNPPRPKGTPTDTNIYALRAHFAGREEADARRIPSTRFAHLQRCLQARLCEVDRARGVLRLTPAGREAIAEYRKRMGYTNPPRGARRALQYEVHDPVGNPGQYLVACADHVREVVEDARHFRPTGRARAARPGENCPVCVQVAGVHAASARAKRRLEPYGFNPGRAHRNRGGGNGLINSYRVPIDQADLSAPGTQEAIAAFRRFHGGEPTHVEVYEYDDGTPDVHEEALFAIGQAQIEVDTMEQAGGGGEVQVAPFAAGTVYSVPQDWNSSKAGKQWVHSHRESGGKPPLHAYNPITGVMSQHGGTYFVDEWIER